MTPFTELSAIAALLARDDIDTDTIIPVPFLRRPRQTLAGGLFHHLRYDAAGAERPDFVLNRPAFRNAGILVSGQNFGCGSSREHAVWALLDFGIRVVIAGSFGDIFHANCLRMGLLPVTLAADALATLSAPLADETRPQTLRVSLVEQTVTTKDGVTHAFAFDARQRQMLLRGADAITLTLAQHEAIDAYQRSDRIARPWVYGIAR